MNQPSSYYSNEGYFGFLNGLSQKLTLLPQKNGQDFADYDDFRKNFYARLDNPSNLELRRSTPKKQSQHF